MNVKKENMEKIVMKLENVIIKMDFMVKNVNIVVK